MKTLKITAVAATALVALAAIAIWLFIDAMTVSEDELLRNQEGALYAEAGTPMDFFLKKCKPTPPLPELRQEGFIQQGYARKFYISEPKSVAKNPALVIVLHGSGSSGQQVYDLLGTAFSKASEANGFIVIYGDGFGGGWNDLRTESPHISKKLQIDDVSYIRKIVDWASENLHTDPKKTYFFGMSNGAQMELRLLVEAPELVTAAAMIGANLPKNADYVEHYKQLNARPVMFVHGTADNVVPYDGGEVKIMHLFNFGEVYSAKETAERWARAAKLTDPPTVQHIDTVDDGASIDRYTWSEPGKPEVRHYRVNGGKHTIPMPPGSSPCENILSVSHDMNTVEEAWSFFSRQEDRL